MDKMKRYMTPCIEAADATIDLFMSTMSMDGGGDDGGDGVAESKRRAYYEDELDECVSTIEYEDSFWTTR